MNSDTPLILVTNDDGVNAPGIRHLINIMLEFGDVVVVVQRGLTDPTWLVITSLYFNTVLLF